MSKPPSAAALHAGGRPRIGLALGSGSARGFAHIGVLRALDEAGIPICCIAGTSIGALVGAVYASGKLDLLETAVRDLDWKAVASFLDVVFPRSGLIDGKRIAEFVRRHVHTEPIDRLPIPFRAVATDLATGEEIVLGSGDLVEAVRASIAVPGILTPVRWRGRILADGALTNPVPVSVARAMGADVVIAVDLNHGIVAAKNFKPRRAASRRKTVAAPAARLGGGPYAQAAGWVRRELRTVADAIPATRAWFAGDPLPNVFDVLLSAINIMETRITESRLAIDRPDVLVRPDLGGMSLMDFDRAGEAIATGYAAMHAALKPLEAALTAHRTV
ncbi:MAG TPA: patatin-like phospholipase family protein [Alphaproteobacteria bacterium]